MMRRFPRTLILSMCICAFFTGAPAHAQTADELQAKINQRNQDIQALEKEIATYQNQITALGDQLSSLSATLKSLDLTQKKLAADIQVSENKIAEKNLEIQKLSGQISDKEETVAYDRSIIASSFVSMNELGDRSLPELLLSQESFSGTLNSIDEIASVQTGLVDRIKNLRQVKTSLEANKSATEKAKADLVKLNKQLKDQRDVVLGTVAEKNKLVAETKQSESEYQKILADRRAQKDAFEKELFQYESALNLSVDFGALPAQGSRVLSWPLDSIYVTQLFGITSSSKRLYASGSHGGVDFRASIGTPVKAALNGTVADIEKTYQKAGCQYGYWVLIRHANGLSTLYGHLSVVGVAVGQKISTGEVIGYSGNTGYTEGPHLHFGVYATSGIRVVKSEELNPATSCKGIRTVAADPKAYLDPMEYLPPYKK